MGKNKMLSKLNLKDYNNELEIVLEKKAFSSDVKNLLLSMLYKVEVSYKDYKAVKRDVTDKEGFIETIISTIRNDCEQIEFIKPQEGTKNYEILFEEKKIVCYQNEISLLEALLALSKKYFWIDKEYDALALPMQDLLIKGYEEDKLEIITDFDGWSWNPKQGRMYDEIYTYCYQILRILKGNSFLYNWKRDRRTETDYLQEIRKYSENLYWCLYKIAILQFSKDAKQKKKVLAAKEKFVQELARMDNKSEYLKEIYEKKRKVHQRIKQYDTIMSNQELLLEEFQKRNALLTEEKKIFSVSDLVDCLQKEREDSTTQLQELTALADPKNYIEKARKLKDKIELIEQAEISFGTKEKIQKAIMESKQELAEIFFACLEYELEKAETKKEVLEILYQFRYYQCFARNR